MRKKAEHKETHNVMLVMRKEDFEALRAEAKKIDIPVASYAKYLIYEGLRKRKER
ncbi:hypothetical protein [Syntrophothermus lipocalidus]|uniref:Uncharacterized protein n=1 Tax=Syntrophothermus lipocalidus (strain DSM 12680 / TGB-C1) TaxID=643648 RepID=D7CQ01_SYNLT|nr:hypothetical protein [Syntrophothermus lipocalidus]ADI02779.1 hypothetical protein Slip_2032 [Syntrophothermus lipocalidus DSM 12680]